MRAKFFFICSTYSPVVRLTACHIKMHYIYLFIYFTIYLFIYIFKKDFYEAETFSVVFQWLCGKKKRKAGANPRFMSPVIVFHWYIDKIGSPPCFHQKYLENNRQTLGDSRHPVTDSTV